MSAIVVAPEHPAVSRRTGDEIEWLIDNADAYDRLLDAIEGARRSVWIAQLALDVDCVSYASAGAPPRGFAESLVRAAKERAVDVRVLLNKSLLLDTATPLRKFFVRRGAAEIRVRGVSRFPQLLHAKIAIIDGETAFLLGSPFARGYWDNARHAPTDGRRPARELGGRPVHDLSVRISGPAAPAIGRVFARLWSEAALPRHRLAARRESPAAGGEPVRVVCTAPRRPTDVLDACLRGISRARRLIYVEHQYLSSRAIVAALAAALERQPALEIIMVLNQNPDVTAYRGWQNARLAGQRWLAHPRVGVFALWTASTGRINQLFVHSKVLVVDDEWATVGSANLDGVSLHSYGDDFSGALARRLFRDVRNFDVNLELTGHAAIPELRRRLWTEHLGQPDGTLDAWRSAAAHNIAMLNGDSRSMTGFALPYSMRPTPAGQLADVGVNHATMDLAFRPGWIEVTCSLNWMRNIAR